VVSVGIREQKIQNYRGMNCTCVKKKYVNRLKFPLYISFYENRDNIVKRSNQQSGNYKFAAVGCDSGYDYNRYSRVAILKLKED